MVAAIIVMCIQCPTKVLEPIKYALTVSKKSAYLK